MHIPKRCPYTCYTSGFCQNLRHSYKLADAYTVVAGALREAVRCRHRVCHTRPRLITRQFHTLAVVSRCYLAHLLVTDQFCVNTLPLLPLHIRASSLSPLCI